ncbi:PAS domain S-box protein [Pedobacter sp. N36a]|uniref:sensor histidine kinase n=1 Tax=Pedobacter sp. N36a TaxID=2767996 RepID=UPI001656CDF6|nr:ATP-binding protein [Pedobacter sp. N36a]MBC8988369.1 PAS domain S-box protein [Pedobacter sp. N36a]
MLGEIEDYAILFLDQHGFVRSWNKGSELIKGYTAEEMLGMDFRSFYTEEAQANKIPDHLLEEAVLNGKAHHRGWRIKKNGEQFWAHVTITAVYDEENEVIGFSKFTRDLTDKLNAEKALKEYARVLEFRNKELEQFVYIASHDLQEPLLTVKNFVGLLKKEYGEQFDENGSLYLDYIAESTEKMKHLIKGVLDYARLGTHEAKELVDCNDLMATLQEEFSEEIGALRLEVDCENLEVSYDNLPRVPAYEKALKQLFRRLFSNALKFRKKEGILKIQVTAAYEDQHWNFEFKDNGIGIEERYKDKIFLIFQRLNSKEAYPGHGIGLSHCKKIVELHGGEIFVKSALNEGSTFCFSLKNDK